VLVEGSYQSIAHFPLLQHADTFPFPLQLRPFFLKEGLGKSSRLSHQPSDLDNRNLVVILTWAFLFYFPF
jgi:hypothetical protein